MRRRAGIGGGGQGADQLRTDLRQGLPRIGTGIPRRHTRPIGPRGRHVVGRDARGGFHACRRFRVISRELLPRFLGGRHGLAFAHLPRDVFHILHEAVEARTAKRNLAAAAVENSCGQRAFERQH